MTVMPFSQGGVFGPADIKAMSIALDEVCSKLALGAGEDVREFLAKRVIPLLAGANAIPPPSATAYCKKLP